jgi:hypothetical protein
MGMQSLIDALPTMETGTEPEYFITDARFELVDPHHIRVYAYCRRRDELHLAYTVVVQTGGLMRMGRQALHACSPGQNMLEWLETFGRAH